MKLNTSLVGKFGAAIFFKLGNFIVIMYT